MSHRWRPGSPVLGAAVRMPIGHHYRLGLAVRTADERCLPKSVIPSAPGSEMADQFGLNPSALGSDIGLGSAGTCRAFISTPYHHHPRRTYRHDIMLIAFIRRRGDLTYATDTKKGMIHYRALCDHGRRATRTLSSNGKTEELEKMFHPDRLR
jgi:hypothetical protein